MSALLPYLIPVALYVLGHFQVGNKLAALVGAPNLIPAYVPPANGAPTPAQVISNAVSAAVKTATDDRFVSIKDELADIIKAAVASAVADINGATGK